MFIIHHEFSVAVYGKILEGSMWVIHECIFWEITEGHRRGKENGWILKWIVGWFIGVIPEKILCSIRRRIMDIMYSRCLHEMLEITS